MKLVLTSVILAGAGSFVVHAKDARDKFAVPMVFEESQSLKIDEESSKDSFMLVPQIECEMSPDEDLKLSIKKCIEFEKTWLKAI